MISSGNSGSNNKSYEIINNVGNTIVSDKSGSNGDIVVISALYNGSNSSIRVNGSETTGSTGTAYLDGITLGGTGDGNGLEDVNIGEVLIYEKDKSNKISEIENYMIDKWDPVSLS